MKYTVEEKLNNVDLIVEELKTQPQTYNTILKELVYNTTCQFKVRKKLNRLYKTGVIFKTAIPGTRFGQAILYLEPRKYKIIVESVRTGVEVYYFFKFERRGRYYIKLEEYWKLDGVDWVKGEKEKILFEGHILRFI